MKEMRVVIARVNECEKENKKAASWSADYELASYLTVRWQRQRPSCSRFSRRESVLQS